jgi:tetratricopeptide (TPR) repeat protein
MAGNVRCSSEPSWTGESWAQQAGMMQTGQVFVSHTSDMAHFPERRSFVQAGLDAVNRAGMAPVDMRYFAAREGKPADYCRQRVRECEIYVAVIGFRYGMMVPGEAVSYTELEFDEASNAGLPRLVFLLDDSADLPAALADADCGAVEEFRQRLLEAGLVVRAFTSAAGLELDVFQALTEVTSDALPGGTARPALEVRYSLPPDTAAFTGRDGELGLITAAVDDSAGSGAVVAIHATPGAGKTAVAVHVAHLLRRRFPDRQLFIDLHGHTPGQDPVAPKAALAGLLTAAGVDARYLPRDLEGRASLWRDRMAGQQALLVLDNAASSDQVAPLLPGNEACLVLITSRRHLGDLPGPVLPVLLEALPPGKAQEMFLQLAPRAATAPEAAVPELARLAGYLPLAVSLLARVYAKHPSWTLADLTRETKASLLTLAAEKDSIAAAFDVSYRYLVPSQQRFFRCLGLHPGTTIDAYAAAALAGIPVQEAHGHLDALHSEGLLTEVSYRRYGMHDLIRRYAGDRAATDPAADRDEGLERLLDYYQHTAAITESLLARQARTRPGPAILSSPPAAVPDLTGRTQALSWARTERASLLGCLDHATRTGQHARVAAITAAIAALLRQDGPWIDAITRHATAVQAARHLGDRLSEANALSDLGVVRQLTGDYPGAAEALEAALRICRDLGDQPGQANALNHLGLVRYLTGDLPGAARALEAALGICLDLGDQPGQAYALDHLGGVRGQAGDYPSAAEALQAALGIYRDIGDQLGEANALDHLGAVRRLTADYPSAAGALQAALGIYRDIGDRRGQANALTDLGSVLRMTGDYPGAAEAVESALSICRDIGDRLGQANALTDLGSVRYQTGDYPGAAEALEAALGIYRDIGEPIGQASALTYLGVARRLAGDYPGAAEALEAALGICHDLGDRGGEAEVLNEVGTLHRARDDLDQAGACHLQALELAREIGSSWDEAHALAGLGRCARTAGRIADAEAGLGQAWEIFQRIGAAEAAGVTAELDALTEAGSIERF